MAKKNTPNNMEDLQNLLDKKEKESVPKGLDQKVKEGVSFAHDKVAREITELNELAKKEQLDAKSKTEAEADLENQKDGFEKLNPKEKEYIENRSAEIISEISKEEDLGKRVLLNKKLTSLQENYEKKWGNLVPTPKKEGIFFGKDFDSQIDDIYAKAQARLRGESLPKSPLPDLGLASTGNVARHTSEKTIIKEAPGKKVLRARKEKQDTTSQELPQTRSNNKILFDGSQARGEYTKYGVDIPYDKYVTNHGKKGDIENVSSNPLTHHSDAQNTDPAAIGELKTHMGIWEDAMDARDEAYPHLAEKKLEKDDVSYGEAMQHYIDNHEDSGVNTAQDREDQFADALEFHYGGEPEKPLDFEAYRAQLADAKNHLDALRIERDEMTRAGTNRGSAAYAAIEQKIAGIQGHIAKLEAMDIEQQSSVEAAAEDTEAISSAKKAFEDAQKDFDYVMKGDGVNNTPSARSRAKSKLEEAKKNFYEISGGRDSVIEDTLEKFDRKKTAGGIGKRIDRLREKHPNSSENIGKFMAWRKRNKWACRAVTVGAYASIGGVWYAGKKVANMATGGALGVAGSWAGGKLHEKLYDKKYNEQAETVAALEQILEDKKTTMSPTLIAEYRKRIKETTEGLAQTQVEKRRRWKIAGAIAGAGSYAAYNLLDTVDAALEVKTPEAPKTEIVLETQSVEPVVSKPSIQVESMPASSPKHVEDYGIWENTDKGKINVETGETMPAEIQERIDAAGSGNDFMAEGRQRNYPHGRNGALLVNDGTFKHGIQNIVGMDTLFTKEAVPLTDETFQKLGFRYLDAETANTTGKIFTNINDADMGEGYSLQDIYEHLDFNKAREVLAGQNPVEVLDTAPAGISAATPSGFDDAPSMFTDLDGGGSASSGFDTAPDNFEELQSQPDGPTAPGVPSGFDAAPDDFEQLNQAPNTNSSGFDTAPDNFEELQNQSDGPTVLDAPSVFDTAPDTYTAPEQSTAYGETSQVEQTPAPILGQESAPDVDPSLFEETPTETVTTNTSLENNPTTPDVDPSLFESAQTVDTQTENNLVFEDTQTGEIHSAGKENLSSVVAQTPESAEKSLGLDGVQSARPLESTGAATVEPAFEFEKFKGESGSFQFEQDDRDYFTQQNFDEKNHVALRVPDSASSEFKGVSLVRTPDGQWAMGMSSSQSTLDVNANMGDAMQRNTQFLQKMGINDAGPSAFGNKNGTATAYTPVSEEQAKFISRQYERIMTQ